MPAVRETTAGDELFRLPLSEFTAARNALAAKLKKDGDSEESDRIKALAKPPVSAWVVNQLYWKHRGAFDRLFAAGERFITRETVATDKPRCSASSRRFTFCSPASCAETLLSDFPRDMALMVA